MSISEKCQSQCIELSQDSAIKIRGEDELYQEAILQSAKFNRQFINDRKTRIPLLDAQTRITQSNCTLWNINYLRQKPNKNYHVRRYNVRKWVKNRRMLFDKDVISATVDKLNGDNFETDQDSLVKMSPHHAGSSNLNNSELGSWYEDSYDNFELNDYDNETEKVIKKQRGTRKRAKTNTDERSFQCEKCGAKYKTKQGLNYHVQNAHYNNLDENTSSINGSIYEETNSSSLPAVH